MEKKSLILIIFSLIFVISCLLISIVFPEFTFIAYFAAVFGLLPYYRSISAALVKKQLDLSLPPIVTIYLLLFLGKVNVALIFIIIILVGDLFKTYILERIKKSITKISEKLPKMAVIRRHGETKEMLISDIQIGDTLLIKSGERVAVDSSLEFDEALVDESVVTGESKPIVKKKGDKLLAGSINTGDYFESVAQVKSIDSTLFRIQKLVTDAQEGKAPLARVVNRYAWITTGVAVTGVVMIFIFTSNILMALSFWIAIVPVIFAIIVPVATTIGITILARRGILVKSSSSLENITRATTFLFDKTGTITSGKPEVEDILELSKNRREILAVAASIENFSNHPLAAPITKKAKEMGVSLLKLKAVKTDVGAGMTAESGNSKIFLGNSTLLIKQNIKVDNEIIKKISSKERQGATPVYVGENNRLIGVIFLLDRLRPESVKLFSTLSEKHLETIVVTGDKKEVAQAIVSKLPQASFVADVSPSGKVSEVEKRLEKGKNIVMVGDGINDAPALAKAQVGIAMGGGGGVELTLNAADIVLLNNDIASIPSIIDVSKKTFRIIKEDISIATFIHLIAVVLVLSGKINLIETTVIHEISSAFVLLNTLRLFKID